MILKVIYYLLLIATNIYGLYFIVVAIPVLFKRKKKNKIGERKNYFEILVPARNEEYVIENLIKSLKKLDYDKERYEITVVLNNSTDNTKEKVSSLGVNIYECKNKISSKGDALKEVFTVMDKRNDIDAYIIFDADNVVDKNFLKHMNNSLNNGYLVAQGFRDTKNISDNWLSCSYAIMYYIQNLFLNESRYNLGKSSFINGTGFVIKKELIDKYGYNPKTVTEDIEFVAMCAINGEKIAFNNEAITYDEQVNKFIPSLKQRKRWSIGTMECLRGYFSELIKTGFKNRRFECFDIIIFYLSIVIHVIGNFAPIFAILGLFINFKKLTTAYFISTFAISLCSYVIGVVLRALLLKKYNKSVKDNIGGILFFDIFLLSWAPVNFVCLFLKKCNWESIKHDRNIDIEEV